MARTCPKAEGKARLNKAATIANAARDRSGHRDRAIPRTAWATIATATILSPWTHADSAIPCCPANPKANKINAMAEGKVKPVQAANKRSEERRVGKGCRYQRGA